MFCVYVFVRDRMIVIVNELVKIANKHCVTKFHVQTKTLELGKKLQHKNQHANIRETNKQKKTPKLNLYTTHTITNVSNNDATNTKYKQKTFFLCFFSL